MEIPPGPLHTRALGGVKRGTDKNVFGPRSSIRLCHPHPYSPTVCQTWYTLTCGGHTTPLIGVDTSMARSTTLKILWIQSTRTSFLVQKPPCTYRTKDFVTGVQKYLPNC